MHCWFGNIVVGTVIGFAALVADQAYGNPISSDADSLVADAPIPHWMDDYGQAMRTAEATDSMLLVFFKGEGKNPYREYFEYQAANDPDIRRKLAEYVLVQVPKDAKIVSQGQDVPLLGHGAFSELAGREGLAIIDLANRDKDYYGHVVSVFPLVPGRYYRYQPNHLRVMLDLPSGTLTQRTMIFAVRIHPEAPASTNGELDTVLIDEANSHSAYQAQIRVQGHHRWGERFQRLLGRLPRGLHAQEVVAESWPHEDVVDAAVDCVDCWRQSSGHWSAVRAPQPRFGYDMRRGSNGIWYATGLFGNNH
ncbi:MAG TPA: hypothetical protein VG713_03530 [Pirellulales bacterium]|nr:hypothetical protein [Pirellulales bacterium]